LRTTLFYILGGRREGVQKFRSSEVQEGRIEGGQEAVGKEFNRQEYRYS
jgi:hypothetical protein